jgi:hypothetical protein
LLFEKPIAPIVLLRLNAVFKLEKFNIN